MLQRGAHWEYTTVVDGFCNIFKEMDIILALYASVAFLLIGVGLAALILATKAKFVTDTLCTVCVNDQEELMFQAASGATLLSALTAHGIPIPCPCGGKATCKQCRVQVLEGEDPPLQTEIDTFSPSQLKQGWRLSCQSKLKHDLKLHVDEHLLGAKEWKAKVISNKNVATFIKELVVEVPAGE